MRLVQRYPLQLTADGAAIVEHALEIQKKIHKLDTFISHMKRGSNHLRIMCSRLIMVVDLPVALAILHEMFPALTLEITEKNFDEIQAAVLANQCDLGLIGPTSHNDGLTFTRYKTDRLCIAVPSDHQLAQNKKEMYFIEALDYPFICLDDSKHITHFAKARAYELQKELKTSVTLPDFDAQLELLAQTEFGIALVLESTIQRARRYDLPVRSIKLLDDWATGDFHCCTRPGEPSHPLALALVNILTMKRNTTLTEATNI